MVEELLPLALLGCVCASFLAVAIGAWMRPNKGIPGWVMAGCALLPVIGVGLITLHVMHSIQNLFPYDEEPPPLSLWEQLRFPLGVSALMVASLGFAFSFLVSRHHQVQAGKEPQVDGG